MWYLLGWRLNVLRMGVEIKCGTMRWRLNVVRIGVEIKCGTYGGGD